jgi:hypothetical protein
VQTWTAHHNGYARLDQALRHERTVSLDPGARALTLVDRVTAGESHAVRLLLHLGPEVEVGLSGSSATLTWVGAGGPVTARLHLATGLRWTLHRGETDPPLGWYSPRFGRRVETSVLVGSGSVETALELLTRLELPAPEETADVARIRWRADHG